MPANRLLQHYVDNARRLPWRVIPGEGAPDPYRVWLSEVIKDQGTLLQVRELLDISATNGAGS